MKNSLKYTLILLAITWLTYAVTAFEWVEVYLGFRDKFIYTRIYALSAHLRVYLALFAWSQFVLIFDKWLRVAIMAGMAFILIDIVQNMFSLVWYLATKAKYLGNERVIWWEVASHIIAMIGGACWALKGRKKSIKRIGFK